MPFISVFTILEIPSMETSTSLTGVFPAVTVPDILYLLTDAVKF